MEAMMMEQMSFGGVGPADFHGDLSASSWMDGLISALQSDIVVQQQDGSPHSSFVDVSAGSHHSPTPSCYDDTLSCIESRSPSTATMAGQNLATSPAAASPIVNDAGWFDFTPSTMHSSGPSSGSMYSSVTGFSSDSRQRTNDGSVAGSGSRDGSVSSCISTSTSGSGISSYGGSSLPNNSTYMKPASSGDYQYRQPAPPQKPQQVQQVQQAQVRQHPSNNSWSNQSQRQFQHHQQIQQQQQHRVSQQQQQHQQFHSQQQQQQQQEVMPLNMEPGAEDQGLRLVQLLIACAQSIQIGDLFSAKNTVMKINQTLAMAPQQGGPMSRVAAHFAEALTNRIYGSHHSPNSQEALIQSSAGISPSALSEILHFQFYETCPYLKFAHFTANQAILEAFKGAKFVHVIEFNLNHGLQWPALIQALAMRPGGPPVLRLTGIGPPEIGEEHDSLKQIGLDLAKLAESLKVRFEFRGVVANKLDDIKDWMLQVRPGEVVAVNSMMQLHKLLYDDGCNHAGIDDVLRTVKSLNPKIVTISEQEAKHNCSSFLDRFMEALHFYSSMFDSLEASNCPSGSEQQMLAEMYLGREINNIVACEGSERLERHETLDQWRIRLRNAGFSQIHMGPNAFKQASMLLTMFSGQGYRVQDNQGCLTLCWHDRPLIAASAWH
ncbi:unnamed protein product [Calypogeia fissa]